jgi:hypothetical protein
VLQRAQRVLRHIGVGAQDDYLTRLSRLVEYFRDFQTGELTGRRGSTYLDIALEQKGACRHRAYAFVITALSAGIPARYVENELHVFAEAFIPVPGQGGYFRRVHLGGAALEQRVLEGEGKVAYSEKGGDPFPKPPAFLQAPPQRTTGLPRSLGRTSSGDSEAQRGGPSLAGRPATPSTSTSTSTSASASASASAAEDAEGEERVERVLPASVTVATGGGRLVYRGAVIRVSGQVRAQGAAGLPVELFLRTPAGMLPLGRTTTGKDGAFTADVEVPRETPLGEHRIVARVRSEQ